MLFTALYVHIKMTICCKFSLPEVFVEHRIHNCFGDEHSTMKEHSTHGKGIIIYLLKTEMSFTSLL